MKLPALLVTSFLASANAQLSYADLDLPVCALECHDDDEGRMFLEAGELCQLLEWKDIAYRECFSTCTDADEAVLNDIYALLCDGGFYGGSFGDLETLAPSALPTGGSVETLPPSMQPTSGNVETPRPSTSPTIVMPRQETSGGGDGSLSSSAVAAVAVCSVIGVLGVVGAGAFMVRKNQEAARMEAATGYALSEDTGTDDPKIFKNPAVQE